MSNVIALPMRSRKLSRNRVVSRPAYFSFSPSLFFKQDECLGTELNRRRRPFQGRALPTELPRLENPFKLPEEARTRKDRN